jgi:hypothetical protein
MTSTTARIGIFAAVLLAAIILRILGPAQTDIAWLLTVGEKWLDGAQLYVDIVETNPPGAVLLYIPAIVLARAADVTPESMVAGLTLLGACASLWLAWRIARPPEKAWPAAAFALGLLAILPAYAFGERDHAALIFLLPVLACYVARATQRPVAVWQALVAGLCGGLALCLRPHDVLALAAALVFVGRRGGWRAVLTTENAALLVTDLAYAMLVWSTFPAYVDDVLPLVAAVYAPVHRPIGAMLINPTLLIGLAALMGITVFHRPWPVPVAATALAGLGALAAMLLQGKGWPYHGYPALALLLFAMGCASWASPHRLAGLTLLAVLLGLAYAWMGLRRDTDAVTAAVAQLAPRHPRMIAISPDIALGQPLTRTVNGVWVGTSWGEWVTDGVTALLPGEPEKRHVLEAYAARERQTLASDIRRGRPDVVLIEHGAWSHWAFSDPGIARALDAYHQVRTVSRVEIWLRK